MGLTDYFKKKNEKDADISQKDLGQKPLFKQSSEIQHAFPITIKGFLLKYQKQNPEGSNIFSKLYGKSKDQITNFKKLEAFLDVKLSEDEIQIQRFGRFQKVKLCDSYIIENMRLNLKNKWLYMEMFSIKDYCKNDIDKNFERVIYIDNNNLTKNIANIIQNNYQMKLTQMLQNKTTNQDFSSYFIMRNREKKQNFLVEKKENFVFNQGVSSLQKIANKYMVNKNNIKEFYTFQNE